MNTQTKAVLAALQEQELLLNNLIDKIRPETVDDLARAKSYEMQLASVQRMIMEIKTDDENGPTYD